MKNRPGDASTPVDPVCPVCNRRVRQGDIVRFGHGELVHIACQSGGSVSVDAAAAFLKANGGRRYCHTCLAELLQWEFGDVRKAVARLRLARPYRIEASECSVCGLDRVTIKAQLPSAPRLDGDEA